MQGLRERFAARFGGDATIYRAPGRVNLIGDHTDYNDGYVLPAAIDRATCVAIGRRSDRRLVVHSENLNQRAEADLTALQPHGGWSDYVFGVAALLRRVGVPLPGANLLITSDVPLGAGLGSSAALEIAVATALVGDAGAQIDTRELAVLCQMAEHEWTGARCGIMDQFIALHGRRGHALLLDCRSLDYRLVPMPPSLALVICNSMVKHSVAAGAYNDRRRECEEAVRALTAPLPHVRALRDVSSTAVDDHAHLLTGVQLRRAHHVISENNRVLDFAGALARNEVDAIGRLMKASHESLRDDFEVSCREIDTLVDIASAHDGVVGARLTGGGFGGCTVNVVHADRAQALSGAIAADYVRRTGIQPEVYICTADDGAAVMVG